MIQIDAKKYIRPKLYSIWLFFFCFHHFLTRVYPKILSKIRAKISIQIVN